MRKKHFSDESNKKASACAFYRIWSVIGSDEEMESVVEHIRAGRVEFELRCGAERFK
jgi:hypothetical protein